MAARKGKKPAPRKAVIEGEVVDEREAPSQRSLVKAEVIAPVMNDAQLRIMLGQTPDYAKKKRVGPSGRSLTYVTHGYVTDQLNKAFGFDWDIILKPMADGKMYALEYEANLSRKDAPPIRYVAVCGDLVVRIHKGAQVIATITKSGFGSQIWLPTMEFGDALKAARSDLLKTCAYQLGIALDLYWNDRAEIGQYEERQRKAETDKRAAEAVQQAVKDNGPTNAIQLIARASSDYGMDIETLVKFAKMDSDQELFDAGADTVRTIWNNLVTYHKGKS